MPRSRPCSPRSSPAAPKRPPSTRTLTTGGPRAARGGVDAQRDVVKNERRQSVENEPYGMAESVTLGEMLYPEGHPYRWPVIGYMPDLTAASYDDVVTFFKTFYAPNNAVLVVTGDFAADQTKAWIQKYFSDIPQAKLPPAPDLREPRQQKEKRAEPTDALANRPAPGLA